MEQKGANYTRPPPDIVQGELEYEVEAIINHRHHGRKQDLQYLLKWKGYPDADNTWEPADQVHAPMLIKQYHKKHPLIRAKTDKRTNIRTTEWHPHFAASLTQTPTSSSISSVNPRFVTGSQESRALDWGKFWNRPWTHVYLVFLLCISSSCGMTHID
jgi:hypothetical protein